MVTVIAVAHSSGRVAVSNHGQYGPRIGHWCRDGIERERFALDQLPTCTVTCFLGSEPAVFRYFPSMREYRFQASDETVASLRALRGAWASVQVAELGISIMLADGRAVRLQVGAADVEDAFEAFRLEATIDGEADSRLGADIGMTSTGAGDFAVGGNDIVLFTGATWSDSGSSMHFSGHPGQLPESAEMVCLTTDAIVVAATTGNGMLIRTGLKPYTLEVVRERSAISAFLRERGYEASE